MIVLTRKTWKNFCFFLVNIKLHSLRAKKQEKTTKIIKEIEGLDEKDKKWSKNILHYKITRTTTKKMAQYLNIIILMTVLITLCSGSAIPMWEFLSRGEKVRFIFLLNFFKSVFFFLNSFVYLMSDVFFYILDEWLRIQRLNV